MAARARGRRLPTCIVIAACVLGAALTPAWATPPASAAETGLPFMQNFEPSDYGGVTQNWDITQGADGVIYVANGGSGVLAFDGARWRYAGDSRQRVVRALARAADGRIYVGTIGDLGYLQPDGKGGMQFVSLRDRLPASERELGMMSSVQSIGKDVFFSTSERLYWWHAGAFKIIKPRTSFHLSFVVDDTLYIREVGHGLLRFADGALQPVADGARFADERIYAMLPWRGADAQPGEMLVGTRTQGWFLYDGHHFRPWHSDADAAIKDALFYAAIWLADGRLAVATLNDGLYLLDDQGHLRGHLTHADGLINNTVYALFEDQQRGLWLATDNGITRINLAAPLTQFGWLNGLRGAVLHSLRHAGTLYVGTTEGLFRLRARGDGNARFEQVRAITGQVRKLAEFDEQLLVASTEGVWTLRPPDVVRRLGELNTPGQTVSAQALLRLPGQPARVLISYQDGLGTMRWDAQRWRDEGRIKAAGRLEAQVIRADADGHIWMAEWAGGVSRMLLPANWQGPHGPRPVQITHFGPAAGLPSGQQEPVLIDGHMRLVTSRGIYRLDPATQRFALDPDFAHLFSDTKLVIGSLHQDRQGELWLYAANSDEGVKVSGHARRVNGRWQWNPTPLQPLAGTAISYISSDPDGTVWLGSEKALYRCAPGGGARRPQAFRALLREIRTGGGDALALGRAGAAALQLPHSRNTLRFEFAAPSFDVLVANRYQVRLDGFDANWSAWSSDALRDYTNLPDGDYRFRARARNVYGEIGSEASFAFTVLPPWYFTWWAWWLWITTAALAVGLLVRWRSAALHRRNRELATLVAQRTVELQGIHLALDATNKALAEQSVTDPLTGLKNRRYLYEHIEQDLALARRQLENHERGHSQPGDSDQLLFLLLDIDHFKQVNDTWGHAAGDRMLEQFRDILLTVARESDVLVRWGGEEFLIVSRQASSAAGPAFAERLRAAVAQHAFDLGNRHVTRRSCSIGFASYPASAADPDALDWEQVVNLADECLYAAKHHGRNAWAGVLPMPQLPPQGTIVDSLRITLAGLPQRGPLAVAASWSASRVPA